MRSLILASMLLLSACGQAGDLYLPSDPAAHAPPPADTPTPAEKKKDAP